MVDNLDLIYHTPAYVFNLFPGPYKGNTKLIFAAPWQ